MASALHRCHYCGYETDLSTNLAAFEDYPHCRQCGLSAAESDSKMQDDLIHLMTRNLQLTPIPTSQTASMPSTPQVMPQAAPITYITQHYHHSGHQVQHDVPVSTILESSGIDASVLLPSQIQLFRTAEPDQQRRLIELWQISPPTPGHQLGPGNGGNWPRTSMEKEEEAAQHRLRLAEQDRLKNLCAFPKHDPTSAEPYILKGYETLPNINGATAPTEYRQSTDPAYSSREWWSLRAEEPMEHQYGMLQQMQMYGYNYDYPTSRKTDDDAEMS